MPPTVYTTFWNGSKTDRAACVLPTLFAVCLFRHAQTANK